jgi:hypothetical protein
MTGNTDVHLLVTNTFKKRRGSEKLSVNSEHPKQAQCVTCLVSVQAMKELGHFQLPGIVYRFLQHGALHYHSET